MLKNLTYDQICHEHVTYYTLTVFKKIIERHNLRIIDVSLNEINGGSIEIMCAKKNSKFKINKIIKEGKEFGGYDSIIFWHQYPRLGLDKTNQWELYRYLPEDYKSIKKIVDECHVNNIKFFIPFKPWDVRSNESLDKHAQSLEKFIHKTNIDGFFLDTMSALPESFLSIQKKYPSFEFCSEGTPKEQRQIEQLTSSWDQIGDIRRNYKHAYLIS